MTEKCECESLFHFKLDGIVLVNNLYPLILNFMMHKRGMVIFFAAVLSSEDE